MSSADVVDLLVELGSMKLEGAVSLIATCLQPAELSPSLRQLTP